MNLEELSIADLYAVKQYAEGEVNHFQEAWNKDQQPENFIVKSNLDHWKVILEQSDSLLYERIIRTNQDDKPSEPKTKEATQVIIDIRKLSKPKVQEMLFALMHDFQVEFQTK